MFSWINKDRFNWNGPFLPRPKSGFFIYLESSRFYLKSAINTVPFRVNFPAVGVDFSSLLCYHVFKQFEK